MIFTVHNENGGGGGGAREFDRAYDEATFKLSFHDRFISMLKYNLVNRKYNLDILVGVPNHQFYSSLVSLTSSTVVWCP